MLPGSSDPAFRSDPAHYIPEEMLVASLSPFDTCTFAPVNGVVVTDYEDRDRPPSTLAKTPTYFVFRLLL